MARIPNQSAPLSRPGAAPSPAVTNADLGGPTTAAATQSGNPGLASQQPMPPTMAPRLGGSSSTTPVNAATLRAQEARRGHPTFIIVAKPDTRGRSELPHKATRALEALAKEHGNDLRQLPPSDMGSALFASRLIYKIRPSVMAKVEAVFAEHPSVSLVSVDSVLRPSGSPPVFSEQVVSDLKGIASSQKTQALRSIHGALNKSADETLPKDAVSRDEIGDAVYAAIGELVDLFGATVLEASRERRTEIIREKNDRQKTERTGNVFSTYFSASAEAIDELRNAGGTPDSVAARDLLLMSAQILEKLGTPRSRALLGRLLKHGDGVIFSAMAKRPEAVTVAVGADFEVANSRLAQTLLGLQTVDGKRPEEWSGASRSRGYDHLPGSLRTESLYEREPAYPFEETPTQSLVFLGTQQSPIVKEAMIEFIVSADRSLPELLAQHQATHLNKEMARHTQQIDGLLQNIPQEKRASLRENFLKDEHQRALESYKRSYALTGQSDVVAMIQSLADYGFSNEQAYDHLHAFAEVCSVFSQVIPKVHTPQMHRVVVDSALSALARYEAGDERSPEADAAAENLRSHLAAPGADKELSVLIALKLFEEGAPASLDTLRDGATHGNDKVQRATASTIEKLISSGRTRELEGSAPILESLVEGGISVWTRLSGAKTLGVIAPGNSKALNFAADLFSPAVTQVRVGSRNMTSKNSTMRTQAAHALAAHGAKAIAALDVLNSAVAVANAAKKASALDTEARERAKAASQTYDLFAEPEVLAVVKDALTAAAWSQQTPNRGENESARLLRYLAEPQADEFAKIPSYSSDRPNYQATLGALIAIGDAAEAAVQAIEG